AVTVAVIGPRGLLGLVIVAGRKRTAGSEAGHRKARQRRLCATGDHDVGVTQGDQPGGVAYGVGAGRAGRHHGMVRALELVLDRDVPGGEVDEPSRNEERAEAARALLVDEDRRFLDAWQSAYAGADQDAGGVLVLGSLRMPAGVGERLVGGGHGVD